MSGSLDFNVKGTRVVGVGAVKGRFQGGVRKLHDKMYDILTREAETIAGLARARIGELFKNPGRMQAAVQTDTVANVGGSGAAMMVNVFAAGLPYLRIHEYGGTVMTPAIFPVNVSMLHWMSPAYAQFKPGGKAATGSIFTPRTRAHPTTLPERSYLRYALTQRREAIRGAFFEAAIESLSP